MKDTRPIVQGRAGWDDQGTRVRARASRSLPRGPQAALASQLGASFTAFNIGACAAGTGMHAPLLLFVMQLPRRWLLLLLLPLPPPLLLLTGLRGGRGGGSYGRRAVGSQHGMDHLRVSAVDGASNLLPAHPGGVEPDDLSGQHGCGGESAKPLSR